MLTVRLFARYAELLGAPEVRVSAEGIATVGDLLARLRSFPGAGAIGPGTLVAVNLRQARADAPVSPEDEIALLPPLAGG
ncbi:MAG TPA: MoaD/ThiS family protein [Gemmatimonadales bacterium]|nr:MoaD/ThiS family protein [Gemmatimonadales bacterium]